MKILKKIWLSLKKLGHELYQKWDDTIQKALADGQSKSSFYLFLGLMAALLFYVIAILDVGIWEGTLSPWGLWGAYQNRGKTYPFGLFLFLAILLMIALWGILAYQLCNDTGRGFSLSKSNVYGSARKISDKELQSVCHILPKEAATGTILGQLDDSETRLLTPKPNPNYNNNIAVFGPPGSGKSFCFVIPTILQAVREGRSVICTDTKGELWSETAEFARSRGYVVRRIDLKDCEYSDGWNILSELRFDDMRSIVAAQIIMKNTGTEKDIHAASEESLLRAVCLYVERTDTLLEEEKNLYQVLTLLNMGPEHLDKLFDKVQRDEYMTSAYDAYCSFLRGSANLRGNVIANLVNRLQVLSSPPVRKFTSASDIDLSLPGRERCIYYLVCSDQHSSMKFIANLFYSFAILDLVDYADRQRSRKLDIPVTFLMEEFANLGEVPNIDKYLSTCRSRRIDIVLIVQSLAQLKEIYGENGASIMLAACATQLCIGYNDDVTAQYFEWRSGEGTVKVQTEQHTHGESPVPYGRGYSTGDGRRSMYTAHELMTIPAGKIMIFFQRFNGLLVNTFGKNRHPAFLSGEAAIIPPEVSVPLSNKKAKDYIRRMEAKRVAEYEKWVRQGGDPWAGYTAPKPQFDGPMRGTPLPKVIPYPLLEDMALMYSGKEPVNYAPEIVKEMLRKTEDGNLAGFRSFDLPEQFTWNDDSDTDATDDPATDSVIVSFSPESEFQCKIPDFDSPESEQEAELETAPETEMSQAPETEEPASVIPESIPETTVPESAPPIILDDSVKPKSPKKTDNATVYGPIQSLNEFPKSTRKKKTMFSENTNKIPPREPASESERK